jgi:GNAT superfamily N-acetyltransferase
MFPSSTRTSATDVEIRPAEADEVEACRELFREYERAIGVSLCFQGFEAEVAGLPGDYVPPRGGLWIARAGAELAGCVALRPLEGEAAEMKRLFVREECRGRSIGLALAKHVIDVARAAGYRTLRLDTLPPMLDAQRMYARLGFGDTPPYNANPVVGVRFMALAL